MRFGKLSICWVSTSGKFQSKKNPPRSFLRIFPLGRFLVVPPMGRSGRSASSPKVLRSLPRTSPWLTAAVRWGAQQLVTWKSWPVHDQHSERCRMWNVKLRYLKDVQFMWIYAMAIYVYAYIYILYIYVYKDLEQTCICHIISHHINS